MTGTAVFVFMDIDRSVIGTIPGEQAKYKTSQNFPHKRSELCICKRQFIEYPDIKSQVFDMKMESK